MRRYIYIAILRLHPAPFRRQFANEMLAIFDDPASHKYSRGLFTDASSLALAPVDAVARPRIPECRRPFCSPNVRESQRLQVADR